MVNLLQPANITPFSLKVKLLVRKLEVVCFMCLKRCHRRCFITLRFSKVKKCVVY